jgi:hypothetical protein
MSRYSQQDNNSWRSPSSSSRITTTTTTVALAVSSIATAVSAYYLYQCVSQHGWEGTFWYLWEGSPYPPEVRQEFQTLDNVQDSLEAEQQILDRLEEAFQRAQLDTVDDDDDDDDHHDATFLELWNSNLPKRNLEKLLARINHNLDLYASQVDAILPSTSSSKQHSNGLKIRKKQLSSRLVQLMKRVDIYVAHYQKAGQQK